LRYTNLSTDLLDWYDQNAREMPWRVGPADRKQGVKPDPYRVWMSEIMLQQTTVAAVRDYFTRFTTRWPTVGDLAAADDGDVMGEWAGLGYYARARNLLKCARAVAQDMDGAFPSAYDELIKLPGIGPYTAAAVASIAFDRSETVVDGNVERVMSRLFAVETPLPAAKPALTDLAKSLTPQERAGDYAQAVMDIGATVCTPKSPKCTICPLTKYCTARVAGNQAKLPFRTAKKPKPTRHGVVYMARRADGAWLLERRPDKGLLGGMLGWPGSAWADHAVEAPPFGANWMDIGENVQHTFTHFHLVLTPKFAAVPMHTEPENGMFLNTNEFRPSDLPTVMRKAYDVAAKHVGTVEE